MMQVWVGKRGGEEVAVKVGVRGLEDKRHFEGAKREVDLMRSVLGARRLMQLLDSAIAYIGDVGAVALVMPKAKGAYPSRADCADAAMHLSL